MRRSYCRSRLFSFFSVFLVTITVLLSQPASAGPGGSGERQLQPDEKLSPGLRAEITNLGQNPQLHLPVIVQLDPRFAVEQTGVLRRDSQNAGPDPLLRLVNGFAAELTGPQLNLLIQSDLVHYVTLDVPIRTTGNDLDTPSHSTTTSPFLASIGADQSG